MLENLQNLKNIKIKKKACEIARYAAFREFFDNLKYFWGYLEKKFWDVKSWDVRFWDKNGQGKKISTVKCAETNL